MNRGTLTFASLPHNVIAFLCLKDF